MEFDLLYTYYKEDYRFDVFEDFPSIITKVYKKESDGYNILGNEIYVFKFKLHKLSMGEDTHDVLRKVILWIDEFIEESVSEEILKCP